MLYVAIHISRLTNIIYANCQRDVVFRRMLKISWTEKKSSQEVLNMAGVDRQLLVTL